MREALFQAGTCQNETAEQVCLRQNSSHFAKFGDNGNEHYRESDYAYAGIGCATRFCSERRVSMALKRLIDLVGSLLALIFLAPLLILVAVIIYVGNPGPIFYGQVRIGRNGVPFRCLKFRSMVMNADTILASVLENNSVARMEWLTLQKIKDDPRVTCFGRFLRLSSIDELPQFLNVLWGQMSLVGPRPIVPTEAPRYGLFLHNYLAVKPGLTGLWQVSGRNNTTYRRRIACDVVYGQRWSLKLDTWIMLKTIPAILRSDGSY